MTEAKLQSGLKHLKDTLEEIRALLAWEELKRQERRPGEAPAFVLTEDVDGDLRNLYAAFLAESETVRDLLQPADLRKLPDAQRQGYRRQLAQLEAQMHCLNLTDRFIKP